MSNNDDKKIIIDEDWKAQVQREKEEALKKKQAAQQGGEQESAAAPDKAAATQDETQDDQEVAASFTNLVSSLAAQAMFALGVIAPQGSKQVSVNLDQANFFLETLLMLQDKTKGNLTEEEEKHLGEALNEMTQVFEARLQQIEAQAMRENNVDLNNLKNPDQ